MSRLCCAVQKCLFGANVCVCVGPWVCFAHRDGWWESTPPGAFIQEEKEVLNCRRGLGWGGWGSANPPKECLFKLALTCSGRRKFTSHFSTGPDEQIIKPNEPLITEKTSKRLMMKSVS